MTKTRSRQTKKRMAKAKADPRAKAGRKKWSASRRTTHKANGSLPEGASAVPEPAEKVPVGEAMRRAVEALGEVIVDDQLAASQMRELGELYEEVARRQAAYDARAEEAKTAKKSLESAQELLLQKVKEYTHPTPLPLFDQKQEEADREAMTNASNVLPDPEGEDDALITGADNDEGEIGDEPAGAEADL